MVKIIMNKSDKPTALRSDETWSRYQSKPTTYKNNCFMCDSDAIVLVREFDHWIIIENNYPYDTVAAVHHLLIPRRHISFKDRLNLDEESEIEEIQSTLNMEGYYDCIMKNFASGQSQPQHLHYHLLTWKRL